MLRVLQFPAIYPAGGDGSTVITFETMAIPPIHGQVTAVVGWVYDGDDLVIVRDMERGWELPGGERRAGETFSQTLARTAWEDAGVLLGRTRMIGAFRTTNLDGEGVPTYTVVLLAQTREAVPFGDAFEARERAFVAPAILAQMFDVWNPLMNEALAFAEAIQHPTPVESFVFEDAAVA